MITLKKVRKHAVIALLSCAVLFFSAHIISYAFKNYNKPQNVAGRLTREIAASCRELDSEIEKITQADLYDNSSWYAVFNKKYRNAFADRGIEILVYKNDSLRFWTSNVFAAPVIRDSQSFSEEVIRTGSGYFLARQKQILNYNIVALQLIRYDYRYANDYLPTGFFKNFSAPSNAAISLNRGTHEIKNPEGKFLFSLTYEQPFEMAIWLQYLVFALYVSSFLFLVSALFLIYVIISKDIRPKWMIFIAFILDVVILRALQFYFRFPAELYQVSLFNPAYYASSDLLPSLGDFLINSLIGVQLTFLAYKYQLSLKIVPQFSSIKKKISVSASILLLLVLYYFLTETMKGLVINSSISFRFENILSLPHISHTGMLIIGCLLFGFLLIFELVGKLFLRWSIGRKTFIVIAFSGILLYEVSMFISDNLDLSASLFLLILFVILYFKINEKTSVTYQVSRVISLVIVLSLLATNLLNRSETLREHQKRSLLASHLSDARDNLAEYFYSEASKNIRNDKTLTMLFNGDDSDSTMNEISNYIHQKYFTGYWSKYLVQITVCYQDKNLSIKPGNIITGCEKYFDDKIQQFMKPVSVPGLYFLRQSADAMYYLGKIHIGSGANGIEKHNNIFIEISSNDIWKGLGYPELLYDNRNTKTDNLYGYSYAFYYKGELVKNVGKFSFDIDNRNIRNQKTKQGFFEAKGYTHYVFSPDANTMIVLSRELPRLSDLISPFSYLFLLLVFMLLIINWLKGSKLNWRSGIYTFRLRLQVIMISTIVISSIVLVTVSLLFINNLNTNKNNEILNEKLNSVLVDLETRFGNLSSLDSVPGDDLSDLLINLSNTYFTDINIYNRKGYLLASSRDQIFREGMISEQINPESARQLMMDKKSFFIEREHIGSYEFLSAYTPVRNFDNHLLGYLNLPYFAKQEEIRREISGLISAFSNIYIIMIVITVMLALLLSRYITKPLQHIGNQFSRIKIGDKNAKIKWSRKDEIGRLVDEYNRMIDEMEKSAELLARSERESAWRQMARQVAHEIKNPLTPIKLSMQLLMRAWNDKAPDWDARLKRFSQTLIMQIDTLSSIATEFSDFAQMPEPQIQQFDVVPLVQQSAELFRDQSDSNISFETEVGECFIQADPNQVLRVFNNLIKNAIQAIPDDRQGVIKIELAIVDGACQISFHDNGTGIPGDRQTRIFSPNFTTKTAGMGLGLAMVKNIIDNTGGRIWFETVPGEGTIFFVVLPLRESE